MQFVYQDSRHDYSYPDISSPYKWAARLFVVSETNGHRTDCRRDFRGEINGHIWGSDILSRSIKFAPKLIPEQKWSLKCVICSPSRMVLPHLDLSTVASVCPRLCFSRQHVSKLEGATTKSRSDEMCRQRKVLELKFPQRNVWPLWRSTATETRVQIL